MTGVGSCARNGTTDDNTYYCGSGPECNNFEAKKCWNPIGNSQSITSCTSSQWLCKVFNFFYFQINKETLNVEFEFFRIF